MSEPDWPKAVDDAMSYFETGQRRVYPAASYLAVIDDIVDGLEPAAITEKRGFHIDLIATAVGHVTTAIHGPGRVPSLSDGGWYMRQGDKYVVAPGFAAAWKEGSSSA